MGLTWEQVIHHFQQQKDDIVYSSLQEDGRKGGMEGKEPGGSEREQGITQPSIIFGTSSNTELGTDGVAGNR